MIVDFAPDAGRLRLDLEAFDALVAGGGTEAVAYLRDAGLLDGDVVHPAIRPAVEAARAPVCVVDVAVAGTQGSTEHRMWLAPAAAACLLHVSDGKYQVFVVDPTRVPALVAKVVRLGPRPRLTPGAVPCPFVVVAGLTAPDAEQRAASVDRLAETCPAEWAEWAAQLRGGRWRMWSARTTWPATNMTPTGRAVTVLDTPTGVVRVDEPQVDVADATDQTSLTATTPTEIWLELTRLLPTDADLPPLG